MNTARVIQSYGHETLKHKGLRMGDQISLSPAQGRKRNYTLTYRRYLIESTDLFNAEKDGSHLLLPRLGQEEFQCELLLCSSFCSKSDEDARYLLRSLNGVPFRVNGILSFEAFIEREDRIDLGFNRFFALAPELQKEEEEHPILSQSSLIESDLNILIEGETGTGKTRLAKLIHEKSKRSGAFVHLNLSSFSSTLLESELFGHVKGAFTGAYNNKKGALALADGGTLFLDEIDSLPLEIQTKLLLFLDDYKVKPVGSEQSYETSPRLIFASGRSLLELVKEKKMRKDFYYRLSSGHQAKLLPLRQHVNLIESLCHQFEHEHSVSLTPQLLKYYKELSWPGNARQLLGHLHKKKVLSKNGHLYFDEHDEELREESTPHKMSEEKVIPLEKFKRDYVRKIYNMNERRMKKTAVLLQISQGTLRGILKENQRATMEVK